MGTFLLALGAGLVRGPVVMLMTVPVAVLAAGALFIAFPLMLFPLLGLVISSIAISMACAAIWAQAARSAGTLAKLQPRKMRPPFFSAVWDITWPIFGLQLLIVLLIVFVIVEGYDEQVSRFPDHVLSVIAPRQEVPETTRQVFAVGLILQIGGAFSVVLLSIFSLPRACGLGMRFQASYGPGFVLARFLIAAPLFAGVTFVIVAILARAVVLSGGPAALLLIPFVVAVLLFPSFMAAFEAALLARAHRVEEAEREATNLRRTAVDYRALRDQWDQRR